MAKRAIKLLDLMTPLGKRVGDCTHDEIHEVSERLGVAPTMGELVASGHVADMDEFVLGIVIRALAADTAAA